MGGAGGRVEREPGSGWQEGKHPGLEKPCLNPSIPQKRKPGFSPCRRVQILSHGNRDPGAGRRSKDAGFAAPVRPGWAANRLLLALTGLAPSLPTSVSRALCLGEFPVLLPRLYSFSPSLASATRENKYFILPGLRGPHTSPTPTGSAERPVISGNSLSPWIPFLLPDPPSLSPQLFHHLWAQRQPLPGR